MQKTLLTLPFLLLPLLSSGSLSSGGLSEQDPNAEWLPFRHSTLCARCHDNSDGAQALRDEAGKPLAPYDLWQSTMMANSARDPFWRAAVAREVEHTPAAKKAIEAKCMRCHSPMANPAHGDRAHELRMSMLTEVSDLATAALDGVSCTICHTIRAKGLGTEASYSGNFEVNRDRRLYGPHKDLFAMPMRRFTGLTGQQSDHILQSKLCGSCHNLETHALHPDGKPTGSVHQEQSPYREWRNSVFNTEVDKPDPKAASCQDCHVPKTSEAGRELRTRIAHNPMGRDFSIPDRSPVGRHLFVGGNSLMPSLFRDHPELRARAPRKAFDSTIAAVRDQLRHRTARVEIQDVVLEDQQLRFGVKIQNLAGHKLPSAYPSRRAWLRIRVLDKANRTRFESGNWNALGFLIDDGGKILDSEKAGHPIQRHHHRITSSDQVQIYEAVMKDDAGKNTWLLMRAAGYAKDNRLLPEGWSKEHDEASKTAPAGLGKDPDFTGGGDTVRVEIPLDTKGAPYRIQVDLVYQSQGGRYLSEFLTSKNPEVRRYEKLWKTADRRPDLVASDEEFIR